jgi:hypothetical protein
MKPVMMNSLPVIDFCTAPQPSVCSLVSYRYRSGCNLTGVDLVGHPANGVCDRLEDDDASKPTVNQVHSVERDTSELDDGVVAASE